MIISITIAFTLDIIAFAIHPALGIVVAVVGYWIVDGLFTDSLPERGKSNAEKALKRRRANNWS